MIEIFGYEKLADQEVLKSKSPTLKAMASGDEAKIAKQIKDLKKQMKKASDQLDFETAAELRDEIKRLQIFELEMKS